MLRELELEFMALSLIVVGLIAFYLLPFFEPVTEIPVFQAKEFTGKKVLVKGIATKAYIKNNELFFWLEGKGKIRIVKKNASKKDFMLTRKNSRIQVTGRIISQNNTVLLVAGEINAN